MNEKKLVGNLTKEMMKILNEAVYLHPGEPFFGALG